MGESAGSAPICLVVTEGRLERNVTAQLNFNSSASQGAVVPVSIELEPTVNHRTSDKVIPNITYVVYGRF